MLVTWLRAQRTGQEKHLNLQEPHTWMVLLRREERGKKSSEEQATRPQISWPVALRAVRGWLPWIMLRRYWHGWSQQPPPPALQLLLTWLEQGRTISLYSSA